MGQREHFTDHATDFLMVVAMTSVQEDTIKQATPASWWPRRRAIRRTRKGHGEGTGLAHS